MKIRTICRVGLSTVQGHILFSAIFLEWCVPVLKRTGLISRDKSGLFVPTNTFNEPTINHRSMRSAWLRGTGLQMFRSCKTSGRCCANTSSNLAPFLIAYIIDAMTQTEVNVPPAISKANLTLSKPCRTWPVFAFGVAGDAIGVSFVEPYSVWLYTIILLFGSKGSVVGNLEFASEITSAAANNLRSILEYALSAWIFFSSANLRILKILRGQFFTNTEVLPTLAYKALRCRHSQGH